MAINKRLFVSIVGVLLVLTASGTVRFLVDNNAGHGWPNNVVRNWQQFGFWALKGKLVKNPGGFGALSDPQVYGGHRPASLYPAFLVKEILPWTGEGTLAFDLVLSLVIFLSTWLLLGKNREAWWAGAAAVLCPGYTLYMATLDPNALALFMALPLAVLVLPRLRGPSLSAPILAMLFLALLVYSALNWTAIFGHGMIAACLLAAPKPQKRRVLLYIAVAGLSSMLVVALSLAQKFGGGHGTGSGPSLRDILGGYGWGSSGYGTWLTTGKAAVRLLFVSVAGLLPLSLAGLYLIAKRAKRAGPRWWTMFAPLGVAVLGITGLRNYYGHHPWMAAPMLVMGVILSLWLLEERAASGTPAPGEPVRRGLLAPTVFLAGCFVYATAVTLAYRSHNAPFLALVSLVREHTTRSDTIVLLRKQDPKMAEDAKIMEEYLDRRVVVLDQPGDTDGMKQRVFVVSMGEVQKRPLVAHTSPSRMASWPLVRELLAWYAGRVARRTTHEQHFPQGVYYLYALDPMKELSSP